MITSILQAVRKRELKTGTTAVNADTPMPGGLPVLGWSDGAVMGGNPGQMGVGYAFKEKEDDGVPLAYAGGPIGRGTNNAAEYHALILAMRHALRLGLWTVFMHVDSQLLVRQVGGRYKVTQGRLRQLRDEVVTLSRLFYSFKLIHVPREMNTLADELSHSVVYAEPTLPAYKKAGGRDKQLHDFQAAAVRLWGLRKLASTNVMARIFGVHGPIVESIVEGKTYRDATFNLPHLLISSEKTVAGEPLLTAD